ncbi:ATP-dependent helicase [Pseudoalteromonas undina]|uniref:ATP-dependent helicase n=1 Tax=Pseudoalteromonas undina TaxID=43660 RepID=A0ACC6R3A9_9GAMM
MADFKFTPDQDAAIASRANMVITACPGSGKTTVVVEKIRNEVQSLPDYKGVIGITFTVKASKELKQRCKKGACDLKSSYFGTIDHFCLSEIIYPFGARLIGHSSSAVECKLFDEVPQNLKEQIPTISGYTGDIKTGIYSTFEQDIKTLYKNGYVLLELLGVMANHILNASLACQNYFRAKYSSLYVDEYQDSSEPQHMLFLKFIDLGLTGVAVGDTQQSIYAWRGSNPEYITSLTAQPDVFEHHIININHRCHPSITNYSNRLFNPTCDLISTDEIRVHRWSYQGTQLNVSEQVSDSIQRIIEKGITDSYSKIGILVRNNISLEFLEQKLKVPFRIFDEDPLAVRNTRITNLFASLLRYRLIEDYRINDVIETVVRYIKVQEQQVVNLRRLISDVIGKEYGELEESIIKISEGIFDCVVSDSDKELIHNICVDSKLLKHYMPINENEVQVMTLHKSKGLEFDVVYHLDLYDWVHPKRRVVQGSWDVHYDNWEQELNLHFVGITRARKHCILVTSSNRLNYQHQVKNGNPSQFFDLPGLEGLYT